MSHKNPPIPSSIFNSKNFSATDATIGGSPIPSPSYYVEYPVAQGANTLISTTINNSLTVGGISTFNGVVTANALITGTITNAQNSTNSTNATNINISDVGSGVGTFYPTFSSGNIGNNSLRTDSANLRYNAGTDTLISTNFQGTATTATQITLQDQTLNTSNFPLVFSSNYTGASVTATSSNLFYKPSIRRKRCAL
jgi:hypothetical protein